ncbi:uncharacterized protein LOC143218557 [Lasioglossum baleicum]|uniref:uncharacterized protein LOC143218557 n=1 Tax=Lasioglossum baleicum TaxID=434251 RepID=UPI003FCE6E86
MSVPSEPGSEISCVIPEVNHVGVRIPSFWPEQPTVWFNQVEAQFVINGVTADSTKYYYVMAQLERKYALEVQDIFANPPAKDKYETLKRELVRRLSASQSHRIEKLLEKEDIGDRTPSQFLRHMQILAGTAVTEEFLRTLWARRLPAMTRAIVNSQADLPFSKLAEIADQIRKNTTHTEVASASQDRSNERLFERLDELTLQVAELTRSRSRDRSKSNFRERSSSSGRRSSFTRKSTRTSPVEKRHCWYHWKFGAAATKYETPCSFQPGNEGEHATECGNQ